MPLVSSALLACTLTLAAPGEVRIDPPALTLTGPGSRHTLLIDQRSPDGLIHDRPRQATYRSLDPTIARVDAHGVVFGVKDGTTKVVAEVEGKTLEVAVQVKDAGRPRTFHFENDIIPLLSRHGCNSSGCHGKAE